MPLSAHTYEIVVACLSDVNFVLQAGLTAHGTEDHELWLQHTSFEQKHGKGAGQVYWRAIKALSSPEEFVAAYSQQGHQSA